MKRLDRAMVLAAGLGRRMKPLTERTPKPLIAVAGRTMLDRALDSLVDAGVTAAVVNVHWLAEQVEAHLAARVRPSIALSREEVLLETGGGVAAALERFGGRPFFVVNADVVWIDGPVPALVRLGEAWREEDMDALLLAVPVGRASGYDGTGDFSMDVSGRLARRAPGGAAPFVFSGVQIVHPRLFDGAPGGAYSINVLWDRAAAAGRLFGLAHDGGWHHVGTPAALSQAERTIGARAN